MNAAHINAVVRGVRDALENKLGLPVQQGQYLPQPPKITVEEVYIDIGLLEKSEADNRLSGKLYLTMKKDAVLEVVNGIMVNAYQCPAMETLDDMAWSAFSEFGNLAGSSCCSEFHNIAVPMDQLPPDTHVNDAPGTIRGTSIFIMIPFTVNGKEIKVYVSIK